MGVLLGSVVEECWGEDPQKNNTKRWIGTRNGTRKG